MERTHELEKLDRIAADSWYAHSANARMIEYCARVFARYLRGGRLLELGPAEGIMTAQLVALADALTVVDGSAKFCDELRHRFPRVKVVHSLFEDFKPDQPFDAIILGHVLEHVADPVSMLRQIQAWLAPRGRVLAAVPNARSLHRQAAVLMGLLASEDTLNEADLHHGHRRVFTPETLRSAFLQAGWNLEVFGGYWMKPVSNRQIEESWTADMLEAFMRLGERYPDIAAEIFVVATPLPTR